MFRLQLYGCLCRCLEKEEDTSARQALQHVNRLGRHIQWVMDNNDNSNDSGSRRLVQHAIKNMAWLGSSLFGSNGNNNNSNNSLGSFDSHNVSGGSPNPTSWNGTKTVDVRARLYARDGIDGEPELWIEQQQQQRSHDEALHEANAAAEVLAPQPPSNEEKAPCVVTTSSSRTSSSSLSSLHIPLRRVDRVTLQGNQIVLLARLPSSQRRQHQPSSSCSFSPQKQPKPKVALSPTQPLSPAASPRQFLSLSPLGSSGVADSPPPTPSPKVLARFEVLLPNLTTAAEVATISSSVHSASSSSSSSQFATNEDRNLLVHYLSVLIEWERQRRRAAGYTAEDDDDDEDDEHGASMVGAAGSFFSSRAQQAAHLARREVEMQQVKRQREQRKAQLLQDSGGLKFTALAMAANAAGEKGSARHQASTAANGSRSFR